MVTNDASFCGRSPDRSVWLPLEPPKGGRGAAGASLLRPSVCGSPLFDSHVKHTVAALDGSVRRGAAIRDDGAFDNWGRLGRTSRRSTRRGFAMLSEAESRLAVIELGRPPTITFGFAGDGAGVFSVTPKPSGSVSATAGTGEAGSTELGW